MTDGHDAMARVPAPDDADRIDDIGDKINDLRTHLAHAHPIPYDWLADLPPAELAALHRRIHGRAVEPDPSLLEARLIELWTDPEERVVTALPLAEAIRDEDPLVWLPMRIADRTHRSGSPGHVDVGGCRACADIINATIQSMLELDRTPQRTIAELAAECADLEAVIDDLLAVLADAPAALHAVSRWLPFLDPVDDIDHDDEAAAMAARESTAQAVDRFIEHASRAHAAGTALRSKRSDDEDQQRPSPT